MSKMRIAFASEMDRKTVYHLRHTVYAAELGQHRTNAEGFLSDSLDRFNKYILVTINVFMEELFLRQSVRSLKLCIEKLESSMPIYWMHGFLQVQKR